MSGEEGVARVSRRDFVKVTGAVLGATALTYGAQPVLRTLAADYKAGQTAESGEKIVRAHCKWSCIECSYNVVVRDGHVVMARPLPDGDLRGARMCLRGHANMQRIYHPNRVKYPMKRAGERGEGKWERISWDEAIATIAEKWMDYQKEFGNQSILWYHGSGNTSSLNGVLGMNNRFANVFQMTDADYCTDMALPYALGRTVGGLMGNGQQDVVNSKTVISWGANICPGQMQNWRYICDAREKHGTKFVVIDPSFSTSVSKADKWYSPRPGADGAIMMGVMNHIISKDLHDKEFLVAHTVAPVLINPDTKRYIRMSSVGVPPTEIVNPQTGAKTLVDPPAVWDLSIGAPAPMDAAVKPALTGTYSVAGLKCETAFDHLVAELDKYSPAEVAKLSDLSPEEIVELAEIIADGPIYHYIMYSSQAHLNGAHLGQALAALCAITGNVGKPGTAIAPGSKVFPGNMAKVWVPNGKVKYTVPALELANILRTGEYNKKPFPLKSLWVTFANPHTGQPNITKFNSEVLDKLDFIVVSEIQMTETAMYADIVLPVTHDYEVDDVFTIAMWEGMDISEKAVEPLYEAKPNSDVCRLLADKMGAGDLFSLTNDEWFQQLIDESAMGKKLGITYERLKKEKQILWGTLPSKAVPDLKFNTPTKRIEFYLDDPKPRIDYGQALDKDRERLPHFFPPAEVWPGTELAKKYPLILQSERMNTRWHCNGLLQSWMQEILPEPIIKINPSDAASRGIENHDYVEVYNDRGHCVVKAVFSEGCRPGIMVYPKGWNKSEFKSEGSWGELLSAEHDPFAVNISFMDNRAEVRKWNGQVS